MQEHVSQLDRIWTEHKEFLRRLLVSFTRDLDLADDLLQETYLHAHKGFPTYRGENPRAWLAAIARNAFYAHLRNRRTRTEVALNKDIPVQDVNVPDRMILDDIRSAMQKLPPASRTALVMKHYGGFTYEEIANRLHCSVGTAKWRVSTAIGRVRVVIAEGYRETYAMRCGLNRNLLLDYVHGTLSGDGLRRVEQHLKTCDSCTREYQDLTRLVDALDVIESDYKLLHTMDIDSKGRVTFYYAQKAAVAEESLHNQMPVALPKRHCLDSVFIQGEEMEFDTLASDPESPISKYTVHLTKPLNLGESVDMLLMGHQREEEQNPVHLGSGKWQLREHYPINVGETEWTVHNVIRLPEGAKLVQARPQPSEIRQGRSTTLIFRIAISGKYRMEFDVDYELQ